MEANFLNEIIFLLKEENQKGKNNFAKIDKLASLSPDKTFFIERASNQTMLNFYYAFKMYDKDFKYNLHCQKIEKLRDAFLDEKINQYNKSVLLACDIYLHNEQLNEVKERLRETDKLSPDYQSLFDQGKYLVKTGNEMLSKYRKYLESKYLNSALTIDDFAERFFKISGKDLLLKATTIVNFARCSEKYRNRLEEKNYLEFFKSLKDYIVKVVRNDYYVNRPPNVEEILFGVYSLENMFEQQEFGKRCKKFEKFESTFRYTSLLEELENEAKVIFADALNNSCISLDKNNFNAIGSAKDVKVYKLSGKPFKFFIESFNQNIQAERFARLENSQSDHVELSYFDDDEGSVCTRNAFVKGGTNSIVLGYLKIYNNSLLMANTEDFDGLDKEISTNSELLSPKMFSQMTENYSRIIVSRRPKPDFVVCFDNVRMTDLNVAQVLNIPIVLINTLQYKKPRKKSEDFIKLHAKENRAYLICSNKQFESYKQRKLERQMQSLKRKNLSTRATQIVEAQNIKGTKLIANKTIAMQKLKENIDNYRYLTDELKVDNEILDFVFAKEGSAYLWEFIPEKYKTNREFIKRMLTINPAIIMSLQMALLKDKSILISLITDNPSFFEKLPDEIKNNPYILASIIKANPEIYRYLPYSMKTNPMILKKIIEYSQGYNWEFLDELVLNDPSLISILYILSPSLLRQILARHPSLIMNCPPQIINDNNFMETAVKQNPDILKFPWDNDDIRNNALLLLPLLMLNLDLLNFVGLGVREAFNMNRPHEMMFEAQRMQDHLGERMEGDPLDFYHDFENYDFNEDDFAFGDSNFNDNDFTSDNFYNDQEFDNNSFNDIDISNDFGNENSNYNFSQEDILSEVNTQDHLEITSTIEHEQNDSANEFDDLESERSITNDDDGDFGDGGDFDGE